MSDSLLCLVDHKIYYTLTIYLFKINTVTENKMHYTKTGKIKT